MKLFGANRKKRRGAKAPITEIFVQLVLILKLRENSENERKIFRSGEKFVLCFLSPSCKGLMKGFNEYTCGCEILMSSFLSALKISFHFSNGSETGNI